MLKAIAGCLSQRRGLRTLIRDPQQDRVLLVRCPALPLTPPSPQPPRAAQAPRGRRPAACSGPPALVAAEEEAPRHEIALGDDEEGVAGEGDGERGLRG